MSTFFLLVFLKDFKALSFNAQEQSVLDLVFQDLAKFLVLELVFFGLICGEYLQPS